MAERPIPTAVADLRLRTQRQRAAARAQRAEAVALRAEARRMRKACRAPGFPQIAHEDVLIVDYSHSRNGATSTNVSRVAALKESKVRRMQVVSRNIRLARALAGLSQRRLARLMERDPNQISEWERGKHEAYQDSLELLGQHLSQEWYWFLQPHEAEWEEHGV